MASRLSHHVVRSLEQVVSRACIAGPDFLQALTSVVRLLGVKAIAANSVAVEAKPCAAVPRPEAEAPADVMLLLRSEAHQTFQCSVVKKVFGTLIFPHLGDAELGKVVAILSAAPNLPQQPAVGQSFRRLWPAFLNRWYGLSDSDESVTSHVVDFQTLVLLLSCLCSGDLATKLYFVQAAVNVQPSSEIDDFKGFLDSSLDSFSRVACALHFLATGEEVGDGSRAVRSLLADVAAKAMQVMCTLGFLSLSINRTFRLQCELYICVICPHNWQQKSALVHASGQCRLLTRHTCRCKLHDDICFCRNAGTTTPFPLTSCPNVYRQLHACWLPMHPTRHRAQHFPYVTAI